MAVGLAAALAACGSSTPARRTSDSARAGLHGYLRQVEPIRLAVNRLLDTADPILEAFRDHRISRAQAARGIGELERRFASYTVDVQAIQPAMPALRSLHAEYAHTYVLEDAYLSALDSGLARDDMRNLPDTQAYQRAAIIAWRTGLMVLARETNTTLPADLQQAGRGEIAPSPAGS
jgi:hypothetical protein